MSKSLRETALNAQFWKKYENCLIRQRIQPKQIQHYLYCCEQFASFCGSLSVADCQPAHVTAFLDNIRDSESFKSWQYNQARIALWFFVRDHLKG